MSELVHNLLLISLELLLFSGLLLFFRWQRQASHYYAARLSVSRREWLHRVGQEAYHFAERAYADYDGPAKLNEAVKYVLEHSKRHGIDVSYQEIRAVVESAWSHSRRPA